MTSHLPTTSIVLGLEVVFWWKHQGYLHTLMHHDDEVILIWYDSDEIACQ